jgi:regulator of protease activity HflC (stomatin/prohibitin superfamily)
VTSGTIATLVVLALLVLFALVVLARTVRIVPQATAQLVERLGRYSRTLDAGLHLLIPFIDRVRATVDLREQVVSFPPQPVITSDNLVVSIDTVIYFQVTDPKSAVYEIFNYIQGIEQLTVTTLRNVIGSLDLEQTLTSRDQINGTLRGVLDEATGKWGIRVNRVELKAIDPPASVQDSMEQQMRAERSRRATILTAEGVKQSQILTAEGEKQSNILRAEGTAQAAILNAQGEPSPRSSTRSTAATPTRSCSPTSTCRCCRRSPAATPTSCGSSPASWVRRSRASAACSARCRRRTVWHHRTVCRTGRTARRRLALADLVALVRPRPPAIRT